MIINYYYQYYLEKHLYVFYCLSLTLNQTHFLLAWYYYKYQLSIIILLLITTLALAVAYPLTGLFTLTISLLSGYWIYLFSVRLYLFMHKLPSHEMHLEEMFPIHQKIINKRNVPTSPETTFSSYSLIKKELFSLWRNPFYRKLKIATWFFYMVVLLVLFLSGIQEPDKWMMLFSIAVFWIHYNVHFSTKYISSDPEWYFRTLPVSYIKIWLAKFSSEIFYVLILLISQWIFLMLTKTEWWIQLNWIGSLLLFAIIILTIVINFQILFYDNPRLAGYAYHLTLLFIVIMSLNYRFVGPVTAIVLLTFYFFKTYRFYNS